MPLVLYHEAGASPFIELNSAYFPPLYHHTMVQAGIEVPPLREHEDGVWGWKYIRGQAGDTPDWAQL